MKINELNSFILFLREAHNIRDSLEILWTFYFSYPRIINIFTKCRRKFLRILSEGRDFLVQIMILTLSGLSAYLFYDDGIAKLIKRREPHLFIFRGPTEFMLKNVCCDRNLSFIKVGKYFMINLWMTWCSRGSMRDEFH